MKFQKVFQILIRGILLFFLFIGSSFLVNGQEKPGPLNIYFFYGNGCPHCAKEKSFLDDNVKLIYSERLVIKEFEVYYNQSNVEKFSRVLEYFGTEVAGVPFLVIGNEYVVGYGDDETTGAEIITKIETCLQAGCDDPIAKEVLLEGSVHKDLDDASPSDEGGSKVKEDKPIYLETYFWGKIDLKSISLPLATILIAFIDGFNPCAMWILIFLISMLINMKDKKKLYVLGSIFVLTSGMVYFMFLAAWFNFFKFVGYVYWIKVIIGIVAIISGVAHIKNFFNKKGGCHATNEEQRESIMNRIKKTISRQNYLLSVIGIIGLAVSVNLVEVVCSAGLPAVYTNLLSDIQLSFYEYYLYLLLYVLVFMIDDLIVFFLAIKTFEVTGITSKYSRWSGLLGGIVILIIGIILIVKPELLMFG